ncbi:helix-turn-helix domain-containing protein [Faecalimonas umbilicata]
MYEQGCSIARLARLCHCSESTIRRHLSLKQHK